METGLFLYLCHPDLMFNSMTFFDDACDRMSREICRTANRLGIPLEYNLLGLQKTKKPGTFGYPCQKFWEIAAEENVTAVIGVDAHSPQHLLTFDMEGPRAMLKEMGITVLDDPMTARKR
jgi:histidinol-phosphatase (PHP family)